MQAIRRLYFYAVAFVSLEIVLWGLISLVRSIFAGSEVGNNASRLAGALSLILVGVPVFLLHWWLVQRSAAQDPEEHFARMRAVFLYGILLVLLVPAVQNGLALLSRLLLEIFGQRGSQAFIGGNQSASDNLIAILVNCLVAGYFFYILRSDWEAFQPVHAPEMLTFTEGAPVDLQTPLQNEAYREVRRLYRYLWLLYSLALVVAGVQQALRFILTAWQTVGSGTISLLANGLALLFIGTPIWLFTGRVIRRSLVEVAERGSLLRLGVLYLLSFISVAGVLISSGLVFYNLLRVLLGAKLQALEFLMLIAGPLSIAIPLAGVWIYYGRDLSAEMEPLPNALRSMLGVRRFTRSSVPATSQAPTLPAGRRALLETPRTRGAGLRRLYYYVLALFGLGATFFGLQQLLAFIIDMLVGMRALGDTAMRNELAAGLSLLLIGLPLWILTWRPMANEASREGEAGDHARRSLVRKSYLYLILFSGVIGVMVSAGILFYQLFRSLLGEAPDNLLLNSLQQLNILVLFALLLAYHWQALRLDNRLAERSLAKRHAQFPVLILAPDEGAARAASTSSGDETGADQAALKGQAASMDEFSYIPGSFAASMVNALQHQAPSLPVAVHPFSQGVPDENLSAARAVILPAELIARPSEALRLWLQAYSGERLVVPMPVKSWLWIFGSGRSLPVLARQTALAVRQLAEGEKASAPRDASPWLILVYILAGLFVLQLIFALLAFGASFILQ